MTTFTTKALLIAGAAITTFHLTRPRRRPTTPAWTGGTEYTDDVLDRVFP